MNDIRINGDLPKHYQVKFREVFSLSETRYGRKNPWRSFESSILEADDLSIYEKMAYIVISSHATTTNQRSWPSYRTIAKKASMSDRKAKQAVKVLEEKGLIVKILRYINKLDKETGEMKRENTSNLYVIFPYNQPFNPEKEWVDENGDVHEKVNDMHHPGEQRALPLVNDMHHPGEQRALPLVNDMHHPGEQHALPLVNDMHPNKTTKNETDFNKTNFSETTPNNHQETITVEGMQFLIQHQFQISLTSSEVSRLIAEANKQGKDLELVIFQTKEYFTVTLQPIHDLVAVLMHGIRKGWEKPKTTLKYMPGQLPIAVQMGDDAKYLTPEQMAKKYPDYVENPLTEEELKETYERVQKGLRELNNVRKY